MKLKHVEISILMLVCTTPIKPSQIICRKRGKARREPGHSENRESTLELRTWTWPTHLCLVHGGPSYWTSLNSHHSALSLQETKSPHILHPPHLDTVWIPAHPCHPAAVCLPSTSITRRQDVCITFPGLSTRDMYACLLEKKDFHLPHTGKWKLHNFHEVCMDHTLQHLSLPNTSGTTPSELLSHCLLLIFGYSSPQQSGSNPYRPHSRSPWLSTTLLGKDTPTKEKDVCKICSQ